MACDNLRASLADPLRSQDVNSTGTLKVALAAIRHRVSRFVYVSSSEAYGSAVYAPMDEGHPLQPTTVYGAAKASGELLARSCMLTYGLPVTIVRPFNAYGPREHAEGTSAEVIPRFVSRILGGLPPVIFGDGSQTRDFTWVGDTARGIVAATVSDVLVGDTVNIAHGVEVSITQIAQLLLELLEAADLRPEHVEPRPGDVARHLASAEKARRVLGFEASTPIEEGLRRYVAWLRKHSDGVERAAADVRNW
jgi:UDP-glucose 4-epimerase